MNRVYNGSKSASNLGPNIWELITPEIKAIESLAGLRKKLRNGNLMTVP